MNKKKQKLKSDITEIISDSELDLYDLVEVLANIFIDQGYRYIDTDDTIKNKLELINVIVKDIEKNGESLPNSLVRQGLLILSWLESKEKNYE